MEVTIVKETDLSEIKSKTITPEEEVLLKEESRPNDSNPKEIIIKERNTSIETKNFENNGDTEVTSHGAVVAAHYNALEEKGLNERNKSRIVYLRNFNNWIKSMLINEYMDTIHENTSFGTPVRVMDMCCGKGGDLLKWRKAHIRHLICADIAETSVEQCRTRYDEMKQRSRRERHHQQMFSAEFIKADCTKMRLREHYEDASLQLDLVSCQFSFHYCFESLPQAECMLRNAAECLRTGGYFIGTIPDANIIVSRKRAFNSTSFGNSVYKIEFEKDEPFPFFGAKYGFSLVDVVNCPEFLVHFPTLERLARKHGLELVSKKGFHEYYEMNKGKGRGLLGKMQALETYPPFEEEKLNGEEEEYMHAKEFLTTKKEDRRIGTLSLPEWEAASLYMVFAFRKMKALSRDAQGVPVYEVREVKQPSSGADVETNRTEKELDSSEEPKSKKFKSDSTT